jgi:hypothetical protein
MTPGAPGPARADMVAVEEPLEIRVAGDTVAITMRTPGADHALAAGFQIRTRRQLGEIGNDVGAGSPSRPD